MSRFDPVRPGAGASWFKAHGLGNDYLVVEEGTAWTVDEAAVRRVCHRHTGVGSDGIVVVLAPAAEPFRLRMFNPDGSEFERSGNGLRVTAAWLHRTGRVETGVPFRVEVGGEVVTMTVHGRRPGGAYDVSVAMGAAEVGAEAVGLDPGRLEAVPAEGGRAPAGSGSGLLAVEGFGPVHLHPVSVGNPHLVVFSGTLSPGAAGSGDPYTPETLGRVGPALATHPALRHGANVQLARVPAEKGKVEALVWERGAGHTVASGTSACAVAVASVVSGRVRAGPVEVRMEGGSLFVDVGEDLDVVLRGPVDEVTTGELTAAFLSALARE